MLTPGHQPQRAGQQARKRMWCVLLILIKTAEERKVLADFLMYFLFLTC
jgi:hypothetical protein